MRDAMQIQAAEPTGRTDTAAAERPSAGGCCAPSEQAVCCEPSAKASCCGSSPTGSCGCR